jgi:hypothetical protein
LIVADAVVGTVVELMVAVTTPLNMLPHPELQCGTPVWSTPMQVEGTVVELDVQVMVLKATGVLLRNA